MAAIASHGIKENWGDAMPYRRKATPRFVQESDEEFARAIGIILPDTEDMEVEDVPEEGNLAMWILGANCTAA